MIIEQLIPIDAQDELEKIFLSDAFPWYFNDNTVNDNKNSGFQFVHRIFDDGKVISDIFPKITLLMDRFHQHTGFEIKEIVRIKANLLTPVSLPNDVILNTFHRDVELPHDDNHISVVYYVIDSDGDTVIFGNESVSPVKGRACYFNSNLMHRATNPTNYNRRIILNFVFRVK